MSFNSYQRPTSQKNDFLFNGIERETELDLGWDLAHFRAYDPTIGRWLQIDPKTSERESPYVGFANMPNFYIDPLGDTVKLWTGDDPRDGQATYILDEVEIIDEPIEGPSVLNGFVELGETIADPFIALYDKFKDGTGGSVIVSNDFSGSDESVRELGPGVKMDPEIKVDELFDMQVQGSKATNPIKAFSSGLEPSEWLWGALKPAPKDSAIIQFPTENKPGVREIIPGGLGRSDGFGRRRERDVTKKDSLKHKIIPKK